MFYNCAFQFPVTQPEAPTAGIEPTSMHVHYIVSPLILSWDVETAMMLGHNCFCALLHNEVETDGLATADQSTDSLVKGLMTRPRPIGHVSEWL